MAFAHREEYILTENPWGETQEFSRINVYNEEKAGKVFSSEKVLDKAKPFICVLYLKRKKNHTKHQRS